MKDPLFDEKTRIDNNDHIAIVLDHDLRNTKKRINNNIQQIKITGITNILDFVRMDFLKNMVFGSTLQKISQHDLEIILSLLLSSIYIYITYVYIYAISKKICCIYFQKFNYVIYN